jgi:hypothetical protein
MLHLDMMPDDDANEVRLVELDGAGAGTSCDDRQPVQELDQ